MSLCCSPNSVPCTIFFRNADRYIPQLRKVFIFTNARNLTFLSPLYPIHTPWLSYIYFKIILQILLHLLPLDIFYNKHCSSAASVQSQHCHTGWKCELFLSFCLKVKVKQSHYRSALALMFQRGWGSQIWRNSAHKGDKIVILTYRPSLPQEKFLVLIY